MTRRELNRIKRRCELAAEGPWELLIGGNFIRVGKSGYIKWTEKHSYLGGELMIADVRTDNPGIYTLNFKQSKLNGAFIAHSKEDIARLVNALEEANLTIVRLRKELRKK